MMTRPQTDTSPGRRLAHARRQIAHVEHALTAHPPELRELHTVVDGAIHLSTALAELVATVIRQAPDTLRQHDRHDGQLLCELLDDLRAMHGCLTTGPLLLAPARDDLDALMSRTDQPTTNSAGHHPVLHHKPTDDVAERQHRVAPVTVGDEP